MFDGDRHGPAAVADKVRLDIVHQVYFVFGNYFCKRVRCRRGSLAFLPESHLRKAYGFQSFKVVESEFVHAADVQHHFLWCIPFPDYFVKNPPSIGPYRDDMGAVVACGKAGFVIGFASPAATSNVSDDKTDLFILSLQRKNGISPILRLVVENAVPELESIGVQKTGKTKRVFLVADTVVCRIILAFLDGFEVFGKINLRPRGERNEECKKENGEPFHYLCVMETHKYSKLFYFQA